MNALTSRPYVRVALGIAALWSVVLFPPWVTLVFIAALALRFEAIEVLFIGMFIDMLWLSGAYFYPIPLFTIASFVILWALEPLRRELFV